jgi:hypothetical protein
METWGVEIHIPEGELNAASTEATPWNKMKPGMTFNPNIYICGDHKKNHHLGEENIRWQQEINEHF